MLEDKDLISVQEARILAKAAKKAQGILADFNKEQIEKIILSMVEGRCLQCGKIGKDGGRRNRLWKSRR